MSNILTDALKSSDEVTLNKLLSEALYFTELNAKRLTNIEISIRGYKEDIKNSNDCTTTQLDLKKLLLSNAESGKNEILTKIIMQSFTVMTITSEMKRIGIQVTAHNLKL